LDVASFPIFPNHKGLNYEFRTAAEVTEIRRWADNKIKTLEDKHAKDEQERSRLRAIQAEEEKRRAEEENGRLEEERRRKLELARTIEQERIDNTQKRLAGWSGSEVEEICRAVDGSRPDPSDIKRWIERSCARIDNFLNRAKELLDALVEKKAKVFVPNKIYYENMEYHRKNGQLGEAQMMQNTIYRCEKFRKRLAKVIDQVQPLRNDAQQKLSYYTTLGERPSLLDFIAKERESDNLLSFEIWINSRYIDDTATLSPVKPQTPVKKLFQWLKHEPLQNQTLDGLEGMILEWKKMLETSEFQDLLDSL